MKAASRQLVLGLVDQLDLLPRDERDQETAEKDYQPRMYPLDHAYFSERFS